MGIPSEYLSAFVGDISTAQLPLYLAHLIVSEDLAAAGTANGNTFVETENDFIDTLFNKEGTADGYYKRLKNR